jgi:PAS domain S-box-containing protein
VVCLSGGRLEQTMDVLYAEHDQDALDRAVRHLARHAPQLRLDVVRTGAEVLQRLGGGNGGAPAYDVLLLDVHLHDIDLIELIERIQGELEFDRPLLLLGARGDRQVLADAIALGAAGAVTRRAGYLYALPSELEAARLRSELARRSGGADVRRERRRAIFGALPVGVMIVNAQRTITLCNQAAADLIKAAREEMLGAQADTVSWDVVDERGQPVPPEELPIVRALETGKAVHSVMLGIKAPSWSDYTWIQCNVEPLAAHGGTTDALCVFTDISGRRHAEQALRDSEERYRSLVETSTELICRYLPDTTLTYVNDAYCRYFGKTREQLLGTKFIDLIPEARRPLTLHRVASLIEHPSFEQGEHQVLLPDGGIGWQQWVDQVILDESGTVRELQAVGRDVTERRRAGQELREIQERIQSILDNAPDAYYVKDLDSRYVLVNKRCDVLLAGHLDSVLGKTDHELFPRSLADRFVASDREVFETGRTMHFEQGLRYEGEHRIFLTTKFPLRDTDGTIHGLCGISSDITDRVRAEERLRAAREMLHSSIDALTAQIAILDEDGTIIAVNASWRTNAGEHDFCGKDHGVGTNYLAACDVPDGPDAHDAQQAGAGIRALLRGERDRFHLVYRSSRPDGGVAWYQMRVTSFATDAGRRLVVAHQDISELKQAEVSLQELTSRLLQSQDDERRRIARELHDVTAQNLFAITLNLTRLEKQLPPMSDRARLLLRETLEIGEHSLQEIRTLSYLLHPPLLDQTGLPPALRWYVDGFGKRSGIDIDVVAPDDLSRLPSDVETALFRVLQESLTNIHRHSGARKASVRLTREGGRIVLDVRDDGSGIGPGVLDGAAGGVRALGVGIPGMRQRLRQLGGDLQIESGSGGTTVIAIVPIGRDHAVLD